MSESPLVQFVHVVMSDMGAVGRCVPWLACVSPSGAADEVARVMRVAMGEHAGRTPSLWIERIEIKP